MRHKFLRCRLGMLSAFMCALILIGALLGASTSNSLSSLNYGIAGRENNTIYTPSRLYKLLFDETPTATESEYLNTLPLTFSYNSLIPASAISTEYDADTGTLLIHIRPYVYTAENGTTVTWTPVVATIDGSTLPLTEQNGEYYGCLENVFYSEDFSMQVEYAWSTEIPTEVIEALRTSAYEAGSSALLLQTEYENRLTAYREALAEYEAWQSYAEQKKLYDEYIKRLHAYQAAKDAYENYLKEYGQYLENLDVYNEWIQYDTDLALFNKNYKHQYESYLNYCKAFDVAKSKLAVMDSLFVADSHGWKMYSSIMGGTVESVIKHKDELIEYLQCSEEDVDLAGSATEELRVLLGNYNAIRTATYASEYEKFEARYAYYTEHYHDLKLHFTDLYRTLNALFQNDFVERVLHTEGKREHYLQFVGQLYVISTCLDENGTRNPDWTISSKKLHEVVEQVHIIPDGDWNPKNTKFPQKVASPSVLPPTPPTSARPTQKPEEPEEVPHYGKIPELVPNPDKNGIPTKREEHPGDMPTPPVIDTLSRRLMQEVSNGTLVKYTGEIGAMELRFTETVRRIVSIRNQKTVNFYNYDGTLLNSKVVDFGASVTYLPPSRETTAEYTYRFLGWLTLEGEKVDLKSVTTDLDLYPSYEMTKRLYTVTWRLEGIDRNGDGLDDEYSFKWLYGVIPVPDRTVPIAPYETASSRYEFSGWDREIVPVTENVTYTGTMRQLPREYVISWVLREGEATVEENWAYGTTPSFDGDVSKPTDSRIYTFIGWDRLISPVTGNATYTAVYEKSPLAMGGTGKTLTITHTEDTVKIDSSTYASVEFHRAVLLAKEQTKALSVTWQNGYSVTFDAEMVALLDTLGCNRIALQSEQSGNAQIIDLGLYNDQWTKIKSDNLNYTLQLPYAREVDRETVFMKRTEAGWERIEERRISVCSDIYLKAAYAYTVSAPQHEFCNTLSLNQKTPEGERISLDLDCAVGYKVTSAKVTQADGTEVLVENLCFTMPASPVTIDLTVEKIQYTVSFVVEGETVSTKTYFYGDEILLPETPTKPETEAHAYTFIGWGDVPAIASGDVYNLVFTAQFFETQKNVDYETGNNNNLLAEVIIPCVLAGLAVITAGIVTLIVLKKRAKRKKKQAEEVSSNEDTTTEETE